jgi:hypothetical protein
VGHGQQRVDLRGLGRALALGQARADVPPGVELGIEHRDVREVGHLVTHLLGDEQLDHCRVDERCRPAPRR